MFLPSKNSKQNIKFIFILIGLLFNLKFVYNQQTKVTKDILLWSGIGIKKEITKKIDLTVEKEIRLHKNITLIEEQFTETKLSYKLPFNFELGAGIRWIIENSSNDNIKRKYRYDFNLLYEYELHKFDLEYRFKIQNKNEDFFKFDVPYKNTLSYRNRIEVKYNSKIFNSKPYISSELFLRDDEYEKTYFNKIRFIFGAKYYINKNNSVNIYYQIERELNSILPYTYYCLGINYKIKI